AREALGGLADQPGATATVRNEAAEACMLLFEVEYPLGRLPEARRLIDEAVCRMRQLVSEFPNCDEYLYDLARLLRQQAGTRRGAAPPEDAPPGEREAMVAARRL